MADHLESSHKTDLTPEEFAHRIEVTPDAILLDVRRPDEYDSGHLPGAININIQGYDYEEQFETLDPTKTYFIYCKMGGRSAAALKYLSGKGFANLYHLMGGIVAWQGTVE